MSYLYINEDNQSFYRSRPESEMTPEGVDALVDETATYPVTGIAFCINVQRALFESKSWETFYGDYDPEKGLEQPAEWRKHGARNLWLLAQRGVDHHARWLARCNHHDIEGWISMRMNDCHGLKEFIEAEEGKETHWTCHWPSTWWREHPELHRAPYRQERSWEGAFDYSHKIVRDHHMNLVREALERWDMFGFELDWMRWGMMFAPGTEQTGLELLNEFMREVKSFADASAKRVGHPVKMAVRLPAEPQTCLALGYDVLTWAEEGLIDMVILSSFLGTANFDYPVAIWRRLLGDKVKLVVNVESVVGAHPNVPAADGIADVAVAAAASALQRGVDGIHLFNHCPSKLLPNSETRDYLADIYSTVSNLEKISRRPRRHAISYPQVYAPGESPKTVLPIPLRMPCIGVAFGRMEENITLRIAIGPKPETGRATLVLGFSADTPDLDADSMTVRVNQQICQASLEEASNNPLPDDVSRVLRYDVPINCLQDDINVVEFEPPQVDGELVWTEMLIEPTRGESVKNKRSQHAEQ